MGEKTAFESLADKITPKDFGESKPAVLYVKVCQELRKIGEMHNIHVADTGVGTMQYTGKHWQLVEKRIATNKLGELAEKMGINPILAQGYKFREELYKQFGVSFFRELSDPDPEVVKINLSNGTYNTAKDRLEQHNPADMFQYVLNFEYDPSAKCDLFIKTLEEVLPEEDARMVLQEYIGYLFILGLKLEKFLTLYGSGSNGKSVILDVISAMLGNDNVTSIPIQSLCKENSPYLYQIAGALANICNDAGSSIEDSSILKRMASLEPLTARRLYNDPIEIRVYAKLIFALNELPQTNDLSKGFWRRQLIIPFRVEIPKERQDKTLAKKIIDTELSGVFNWALEGLRRLIKNQAFSECKSAEEQLKAYQREQDNVAMFLSDAEPKGRVLFRDFYGNYQLFCSENGYRQCSKGKFKSRLLTLGVDVRNGSGNVLYAFFGEEIPTPDMPF